MSDYSDLEERVEKLEDKFEYPSVDFDKEVIEFLKRKIEGKAELLAQELGYEWQEGGRWVWVKKTRKYKRRKK